MTARSRRGTHALPHTRSPVRFPCLKRCATAPMRTARRKIMISTAAECG
ncbi:hypothetical protein COLSTE_01664 [Collinsella stercoris DSM 13279]|uniref:Uncharacterized protein n=1 Tax=Collinsella stercoris DSM 13279 TaxID=445975 RepID=B6GC45_9ACTN|nr:hypothetical protein COLSTE_01664 [Collinsella stercoris DSM 13279]